MEKEILEGNKLIAAFVDEVYKTQMGNIVNFINKPTPFETSNSFEVGELQYHTSWDWLMPVVDKIIKTHPLIKTHSLMENAFAKTSKVVSTLMYVQIDRTWKAVVEFIEWYNSNKKLFI